MATKSRNRPRIGDTAWFVEWCVALAIEGDNPAADVAWDNCKMAVCQVASKAEAERMAKEVYPQATKTFGVVEYWPAEFVAYDEADAERYPHVGFWTVTADPEFYEGED